MTGYRNCETLARYRGLILLSLSAQERDDVEQEDRVIDDLDALWSKMTRDERRQSETINREMTIWFSSRDRQAEQLTVGSVVSAPSARNFPSFVATTSVMFEAGEEVRNVLRSAVIEEWRVGRTSSKVSLKTVEPSAFVG